LMSQSGRERETATVHPRGFVDRPRPRNRTLMKVLDDVA